VRVITAAGTNVIKHYDAADNVIEVDYRLDGNAGRWANVRTVATWDADNQQTLTEVFRDQYTTVGSTTTSLGTVTDQIVQVKYNAFGEIVAKGDSASPTATLEATYSYDAAGRMTSSNAQGGVLRSYGYNAVREMLSPTSGSLKYVLASNCVPWRIGTRDHRRAAAAGGDLLPNFKLEKIGEAERGDLTTFK